MTRDVGRDVDSRWLVYGVLVSSYAMHILPIISDYLLDSRFPDRPLNMSSDRDTDT